MATDAPSDRAALVRLMAEAIDWMSYRATRHDNAASVLTAIEAAGCRVVPVQATLTMKEGSSVHFALEELEYENIRPLWESMLNGSPYAPETKE